MSAEVIVIGAGLCGLVAARELRAAGTSVVLIEARERAGGRAWTGRGRLRGFDIEFGGMYVDPRQEPLMAEVRRYGLQLEPPSRPSRFRWLQAGVRRDGLPPVPVLDLPDLERAIVYLMGLASQIDLDYPLSAQDLDHIDVPMCRLLRPLGLGAATSDLIAGALGEHASGGWDDASALELLAGLAHSGSVAGFFLEATFASQVQGGTAALVDALVAEVGDALRLGQPVRAVHQDGHRVVVDTDELRQTAGRVVCTIPVNVLPDVCFTPALQSDRARCIDIGHVGTGQKFYALVRGVDAGLLAYGPGPEIQLVIAERHRDGETVLVCFGAGKIDVDNRYAVAEGLRPILPEAEVIAACGHDWAADPWSRGTWAVRRAGTRSFWDALPGPDGRVFFATADVGTEWSSSMAGAIESGIRAAEWARGRPRGG